MRAHAPRRREEVMAFSNRCRDNYALLLRAAERGDLALLECTDRVSGAPAYIVCDMRRDGDAHIITPLARLHDGDPADLIWPPGHETTIK
jgi:hypothetical protein